jgi:hydrogenase nickel incorporation protein HypA/HybF
MHELSLAMEVIEMTQREAGKNGVSTILEIQVEVGDLSGIEADVFQSALEMVVKDTLLENSLVRIIRSPGKGKCSACNLEFEMKNLFDSCPQCGCLPSQIIGGQEFRVLSLVAE